MCYNESQSTPFSPGLRSSGPKLITGVKTRDLYGLHDTGDTKSGLKTIPRVVGQPRFKRPL